MDFPDTVREAFTHDIELSALHRVQILGLRLDLVPGQLRLRQPDPDHGISKLGDTILVRRDARLELSLECDPQPLRLSTQLTALCTELLARGLELGGLIVRQLELFLCSRGKTLLDPLPQ